MNVRKLAGLSTGEACQRLKAAGWVLLGSGCAAYAFGHPRSARCIKIVCADEGQRAAVKMFQSHRGVAAFPRVFSFADLEDRCFAYEMERLIPQKRTRKRVPSWDPRPSLVRHFGAEVADIILDTKDKLHAALDLHQANIMLRADGTPVAVDPFYLGCSQRAHDDLRQSLRKAA